LAYSMNVMTSHVIEKQKCLYWVLLAANIS